MKENLISHVFILDQPEFIKRDTGLETTEFYIDCNNLILESQKKLENDVRVTRQQYLDSNNKPGTTSIQKALNFAWENKNDYCLLCYDFCGFEENILETFNKCIKRYDRIVNSGDKRAHLGYVYSDFHYLLWNNFAIRKSLREIEAFEPNKNFMNSVIQGIYLVAVDIKHVDRSVPYLSLSEMILANCAGRPNPPIVYHLAEPVYFVPEYITNDELKIKNEGHAYARFYV